MRFHYAGSKTPIANDLPLAKVAGDDGFTVPDSLIYPGRSDTSYSYTDDGGREFLENEPFVETLTPATAMLTATERLEVVPVVFRNLYAVEEDRQPVQEKIENLNHFADRIIATR